MLAGVPRPESPGARGLGGARRVACYTPDPSNGRISEALEPQTETRMTMTIEPKSRRTNRRRVMLVAALAGMSVALGCDDGATPEQITSAQAKLLSVSAGGLSAPTETRRRVYQSVVSELQSSSGDLEGVAGETAAALMGEAQAGLAQIEQAEALDPATEVAALLSSARLAASEFANQSAIAAAMRSGDSGADLDRIATEAQRVAQEIEQARMDREGLVAQVAQLNRRQQEQREQSTTIRQQEAGIRQDAIRADADRRAELTEQAYRLSRRAAEFEREASDLQAQADVLLPEVRNAEIREQQLNTLAAQLNATKTSIEAERARRLEDARSAEQVALDADARLTGIFEGLRAALNERFEPASGEAISASERAIGTLRRANNRLALASAQQGLGDAQRLRATTFGEAASLLEHLANLSPSPSVASEAGALAAEIVEKAEAATEAAAQAYSDSATSLRSGASRAQGETRQRVDSAVAALEGLAASLRGEDVAAPEAEDDPSRNEE